MDEEFRVRMKPALEADVFRIDPCVHVTLTHPHVNVVASRHASHVRAEEHVRQKENLFVRRDRIHDFDGVARRAAVVALGLHFRRRVDVRDHDGAGVLRFPVAKLLRVDGRGERASGREIRQEHGFFGRQNRGGLRHEMHAAKHDGTGGGLGSFAREAERVADEIRDILDFGSLVVVGEHDRVASASKLADFRLQIVDLGLPGELGGACHEFKLTRWDQCH